MIVVVLDEVGGRKAVDQVIRNGGQAGQVPLARYAWAPCWVLGTGIMLWKVQLSRLSA